MGSGKITYSALITVEKNINIPRFPNIIGIRNMKIQNRNLECG